MNDELAFARRPTGEDITVKLKGFLGGAFGGSGSGKSEFVKRLLIAAIQLYGALLQIIIIDPKQVGFGMRGWDSRAYVYTDPLAYGQVLTSLLNEIDRRYLEMSRRGSLEISEERPLLLAVLEETPMITGNAQLTKRQQESIVQTITALSQRARQANVSILLASQSAATVFIPNQIRANLDQRFVFKLASEEEAKMACAGRMDEYPANTLYLPGEGYFLTSTTRGQYVRGRVKLVSDAEERQILGVVRAIEQRGEGRPQL